MYLLLKVQSLWEDSFRLTVMDVPGSCGPWGIELQLWNRRGLSQLLSLQGQHWLLSCGKSSPFGCFQRTSGNCVCQRPLLMHPSLSWNILLLPSPTWRSACHFGAFSAFRRENLDYFLLKAFFLSQNHLNLCPIRDIFKSLFWTTQLKSEVCES